MHKTNHHDRFDITASNKGPISCTLTVFICPMTLLDLCEIFRVNEGSNGYLILQMPSDIIA
jgi:hypothetical protein